MPQRTAKDPRVHNLRLATRQAGAEAALQAEVADLERTAADREARLTYLQTELRRSRQLIRKLRGRLAVLATSNNDHDRNHEHNHEHNHDYQPSEI